MALTDEVIARVSGQRLIELTNPGSPSATSNDTTRLANAATDASAEMQMTIGEAYDGSNAMHVAAGVEGVLYYLHLRAGTPGGTINEYETRWRSWLGKLAQVRGRDRLLPKTDSKLTQPSEVTGSDKVASDFHKSRWGSYIIDNAPDGN